MNFTFSRVSVDYLESISTYWLILASAIPTASTYVNFLLRSCVVGVGTAHNLLSVVVF